MAYIVPIHRASSIRHAIRLSFLNPDSDDLIIAKSNRLEIWSTHPDTPNDPTLHHHHTRTIYGKITLLHKLRPATSPTDHLFIGTDRYHFFTLSWDPATRSICTEKTFVDVAEKSARDSQTGDRVHIDPTQRFLTLECYEGVVTVIPITHGGKGKRRAVAETEVGELGEPIPVRIPELFVRSSCFVYKRIAGTKLADPEFAVLYEDASNRVRVKVRQLEFAQSLRPSEEPSSAELEKEREVVGTLELGASHLIPLPPPIYGMLVVGETSVSYVDEWDYKIRDTQPLAEATVFVAWCQIDEQRYALADDYGMLYLLMVQQNAQGEYAGHRIEKLGETSRASTLVYLDGGRVFVGSHQGDSQIIQILPGSLEVLQTFSNIAPVLDFTVMDMGNRSSDAPVNEFSSGQARIVTGSGAFKDGSLRSVRSGVGLEDRGELGSLDATITSLFSLRSKASAEHVDTLVVSFVDHTRVFVFANEGGVEEVDDFNGLSLTDSTLHADSLASGHIIQTTSSSVLLADSDSGMVVSSWSAPANTSISAVSSDGDTLLVSLQGASVLALDLSGGQVKVQAQRQFETDQQVSCIALSSAIPGLAVIGFWQDSKVSLVDLNDKTLTTLNEEIVADDDSPTVPRSLAIASILSEQPPTLFVGLADGNVVTYTIESPTQPFQSRKSIILGTQQANFTVLIRTGGLQNVFAICEHPSLIYGSDGRMVYSAVTAEKATAICSFNSFEPYGNAIAIAAGDELKIAVVDEERTTHVQHLSIHETVRRIAYSPDLKAFGLGCIKRTLSAGVETVRSHLKLVDEIAFKELDTFALNEDELIESVIRCKLADGSTGGQTERFVVGTAYLDDQDDRNTRGRILVLEVTEQRKLSLITEVSTKGACRCLAICEGMIVAALIKTVVIFEFLYQSGSTPRLVKRAFYRTATAPIDLCVTDSNIAVVDLMKSLSLIQYTRGTAGAPDTLTEIARHFETVWGTAVAAVDDSLYLEADAEGNLILLQHDTSNLATPDDQRRLRVTADMLLGEMVNRIRRIDVVPSPGALVIPRAFLATVDGSIYLFALIAPAVQDLLMRVQTRLAKMVLSPGQVPFNRYRGFRSQVRDMGAEGPMRFVDGELIERFLDCGKDVQGEVVKGLGVGVEEFKGMVESLRRIH